MAVRILLECMLVTDCMRSMGKGYVFTSVCHTVHGGGGAGGGVWHNSPTPMSYGQPAVGTHPTGMHSCLKLFSLL